jgi:hypothetical protein
MFVAGHSSNIAYPLVRNALDSGNLRYFRENSRNIKLSLRDAITVCLMIADQTPARFEAASVHWIQRYAAEARKQRRDDYRLIVLAFDSMMHDPELTEGQLTARCAARGLGQ